MHHAVVRVQARSGGGVHQSSRCETVAAGGPYTVISKLKFAVLFAGLAVGLAACGPKEPQTSGAPLGIRRMSEEQYRNVIADVFGSGIVVSGRFDPMIRTDGLLAVGAWKTSITPQGFVQYE